MNHGGKHWIQGAERMLIAPDHVPGAMGISTYPRYQDEESFEYGYCSIGALHELEADYLPIIALAEVINPAYMKETRADLVQDARMEREYYSWWGDENETLYVDERLAEAAEEIIVAFNDSGTTSWDDVRSAFTKAAKRMADRARR